MPYTTHFTSMLTAFTQVWDLMLGSNDYRFETPLGLILYFIFTVFVQIAMLNIVISVVGDIYDRVQKSKKEVDLQTKAELLYDFAEFLQMARSSWLCCCIKKRGLSKVDEFNTEEVGYLYVL